MYKTDYIDVTYFSARKLLEALQEAIAKYGIDCVNLDHMAEYDSVTIHLACQRPFTEEEKAAHAEAEAKLKEYRRQQYLQLKKEFNV